MPLAVDLFSGLGGWAEGLEAEGWTVIRVDIEDMFLAIGTPKPAECLLVLQDVRTVHGSQFKRADLIVSSSPCQDFSWRAMPWTKARTNCGPFLGLKLFHEQFRIQRECNEARAAEGLPPTPMIVENVRGAIPWVGRSRYNYGSYHLWGDVPALMPSPRSSEAVKAPGLGAGWVHPDDPRHTPGLDFTRLAARSEEDGRKVPGFRFDGSGRSFQTASVDGMKTNGGIPHIRDGAPHTRHLTNPAEHLKGGGDWFSSGENCSLQRRAASGSTARKAASAKIAKIPEVLARHIGRTFLPMRNAS
jgi:hypothetical protein